MAIDSILPIFRPTQTSAKPTPLPRSDFIIRTCPRVRLGNLDCKNAFQKYLILMLKLKKKKTHKTSPRGNSNLSKKNDSCPVDESLVLYKFYSFLSFRARKELRNHLRSCLVTGSNVKPKEIKWLGAGAKPAPTAWSGVWRGGFLGIIFESWFLTGPHWGFQVTLT